MYKYLLYGLPLVQIATCLAVLPFVLRRVRIKRKEAAMRDCMYDRCIAIMIEIRDFETDRFYMDELFADFEELTQCSGSETEQTELYAAFVDKWEAKIAGGEILRTRGRKD